MNKSSRFKKITKKMLDKRFQGVLKLSTVCEKCKRNFLEIIKVIQNRIQTNETPNGSPAPKEVRLCASLSVCLRAGFDNPNYQTRLGGLDRARKEI